jgi:flagellum-specific peptidoglycan hydrolase FlgJ
MVRRKVVLRVTLLLSKYRALIPYIEAQAKHETGNFKSVVYNSMRNLFGMKHPTHRPSVGVKGMAASDGGNYQKYSSDAESVHDLLLWMDYTKFPTQVKDSAEYAEQLKARGYFTAGLTEYKNALIHWIKK